MQPVLIPKTYKMLVFFANSAFVAFLVVLHVGSCSAQFNGVICDAAADKCPWQGDGECDSELGYGVDKCLGGDCFDCDPCQVHRYDCSECVSNGCYFCPEDSSCLSTTQYQFNKISSCMVEEDFATTCGDNSENLFSDPQYSAQRWVYDMINVVPVWQQGISGSGVRVRINDDGVDSTHPEFEGRFDYAASCPGSFYASSSRVNDGTAVASIIAAGANNENCAVGIAPNATISACYGLGSSNVFLDTKLDTFDISQNSYNIYACSLGFGRRRHLQEQRISTCPFTFVDPNQVSPCEVCDFAETTTSITRSATGTPSERCKDAVIAHCKLHYEDDPIGCIEFLDILIPGGQCLYSSLTNEQVSRISNGITYGRNGKGTVFVYSAGNKYKSGEDVNFEGYLNTRLTIPVGAVGKDGLHASYSTPGTALFLTAPGGDSESLSNFFVADFDGYGCRAASYGTSYSSAVVSGVIALMLEANPDLGWRDVQWILALTSNMVENDPHDNTLVTNGAGFRHSNFYGFGIVDAEAAVNASKSWDNVSPEFMVVTQSNGLNLHIPDDPAFQVTSSLSIRLNTYDFIVESVVVYLDLHHASRGDLDVVLTSPDGTESLLHPGNRPERSQLDENEQWKLLTVRNWGESAMGDWTLSITDVSKGYVSDCVDRPFTVFSFGVDVRCLEVELSGICSDGELNESFFNGDKNTMNSFIQTTSENGFTALDACCACGGGISATNTDWVDELIDWQLIIYGQNITEAPSSSGRNGKKSRGSGSPLVGQSFLNILTVSVFVILSIQLPAIL